MKKILSLLFVLSFIVSVVLVANGQNMGFGGSNGGFSNAATAFSSLDAGPKVMPLQQMRISVIGTNLAKKHETLSQANKLYDAIIAQCFLDKEGVVVSPETLWLPERRITRVVGKDQYLFLGGKNMLVQTTGLKSYADKEVLPSVFVIEDGTYSYDSVKTGLRRTVRKYRQSTLEKEVAAGTYTLISRDKFVELLKAGNSFSYTLPGSQVCPTTVLVQEPGRASRTERCPKCNGTGKIELIEPWEVIW
jgi:hypothetical protein